MSCNVQTFETQMLIFFSLSDFYLFCKKSNRRQEFNDIVFFLHLSVNRKWGMATGEMEAVYFLLIYTLDLSYIFIQEIQGIIFLYNFGQKWLDTLSSSSHWKLTCSRHDVAELGLKQQSLAPCEIEIQPCTNYWPRLYWV